MRRKMLLIASLFVIQSSIAGNDMAGNEIATNRMADNSGIKSSKARQGELLYLLKHDCGSCHGMTLKGGLGPALLPQRLAALPRDYLTNTIMNGREGTAMPGWGSMLTHSEAAWIAEQLQKGLAPQTAIASGDAARGDTAGGNEE